MNFKVSHYKGSYSATAIAPTDKEVLFVLNNLEELINNKRIYSTCTTVAISEEPFCYCGETKADIYRLELSEKETDVPQEDWDGTDEYRVLSIMQCQKCGDWMLYD